MSLSSYLRVVRKRWWIIALGLLTGLSLAFSYNSVSAPIYESQTRLFVSTISAGNTTELLQSTSFGQQRVRSYADVVSSPLVLQPVIDDLGLEVTAGSLARQVTVSVPLNTVIIAITVANPDPLLAQEIATRIGQELEGVVATLEPSQVNEAAPVKLSTIQPANVPLGPSSPQVLQNLAIGAVAGLILALSFAFLIEALDTRVRNEDSLFAVHQSPVLGRFVFDPSVKRRPLLIHAEPGSPRAEAFRHMRTNLQFIAAARSRNSFVVSSAVPAEGKSTTAVNLAIAAAQADTKVLLIDCDLRRPKVATNLRLAGSLGLTGFLTGRAQIDDVIKPWGDGNLSVLPAGKIPPNPSELLGSKKMQELLDWAEKTWDLVILDSPPILPATDAAILSTMTGGLILAVRSGKTTRGQLGLAVDHIMSVDGHIAGYALTMVPAREANASRYGYAKGYQYGYSPRAEKLGQEFASPTRRRANDGPRKRRATLVETSPGQQPAQQPVQKQTQMPVRQSPAAGEQVDVEEWLDRIARQPPTPRRPS